MKIKKYIWLPLLLLGYFAFMTVYFGRDLLVSGQTTRFTVTVVAELVVLTALFFSLRKRDRYKNE